MIGQGVFEILLIKETKLDAFFPVAQFCITDLSTPYRLGRNQSRGGIIIYVQEDSTSKMLTKHKLLLILKHYLSKLIFTSGSGYIVSYTTHLLNQTNIFLIA